MITPPAVIAPTDPSSLRRLVRLALRRLTDQQDDRVAEPSHVSLYGGCRITEMITPPAVVAPADPSSLRRLVRLALRRLTDHRDGRVADRRCSVMSLSFRRRGVSLAVSSIRGLNSPEGHTQGSKIPRAGLPPVCKGARALSLAYGYGPITTDREKSSTLTAEQSRYVVRTRF